ncbi:hypothetical protein [Stenotrophomonas sp. GD03657]|uniref:hypothetical protein n=1 Tax=Stenotrophomonas sp. GD03657 TaxID=2975363 RepID=UPI00244BE32A|nr:hypothetical protein [Stenotrophomonas sp. GD03657]MDH2154083.1 hypothetical protein [Stenotrophomonas sp. GD03657]
MSVEENRKLMGSMKMLLEMEGNVLPIVINGSRYSDGYYAIQIRTKLADMLIANLHNGDDEYSGARSILTLPWFPAAIGDTPAEAMENLSKKLDSMSASQFDDVLKFSFAIEDDHEINLKAEQELSWSKPTSMFDIVALTFPDRVDAFNFS